MHENRLKTFQPNLFLLVLQVIVALLRFKVSLSVRFGALAVQDIVANLFSLELYQKISPFIGDRDRAHRICVVSENLQLGFLQSISHYQLRPELSLAQEESINHYIKDIETHDWEIIETNTIHQGTNVFRCRDCGLKWISEILDDRSSGV